MDAKPEVEYDIDKHQKIASLMSVDEIHFIDDTGTIYSGSIPKYFGYSFDSGEQMAFFKQMLNNKDLTLCQDVTPNTENAYGSSGYYAKASFKGVETKLNFKCCS